MGTYSVTVKELVDPLEDFLRDQEGEIAAETMAKAWNQLAKKYGWADKLKSCQPSPKKRGKDEETREKANEFKSEDRTE